MNNFHTFQSLFPLDFCPTWQQYCNSELSFGCILPFGEYGTDFLYLLKHDASQYGASTQQQWQHAHQSHSHIKCYTSVVLSWRSKGERRAAVRCCICIITPIDSFGDSPCPETLGSLHSFIIAWLSNWIFTLPLWALLSSTIWKRKATSRRFVSFETAFLFRN